MRRSGACQTCGFKPRKKSHASETGIARWISIYFPEYKDVYGKMDAVSGLMVLKEAPLPAKIRELGAEGINQIWRNAKLRGAGMKRAKTLLSAAEHSIGSQEAPEAAALEIESLLEDYEKYKGRMAELMEEWKRRSKRFHMWRNSWRFMGSD